MPSPFPHLIAVLALAASTALAQEAAPAGTSPSKAPEASTEAVKTPEKKAATTASTAEVKKTEAKPAETKPAPTPVAKSKSSSHRVPFVARNAKPEADEEEQPRSFWDRLFFRHRHREAAPASTTPAATPAPKATPRPKKPKPAGGPAPDTTTAPAATPAPKTTKPKTAPVVKPTEKSVETSTTETPPKVESTKPETTEVEKPVTKPAPVSVPKATPTPKATPAPKTSAKTTKGSVSVAPAATPARKAPVAPTADADADAQEKYHYEVAKNKALEDSEVQKLKEKADSATTDDEARKAQRAYNKALFNKMRSIDGSIKDRADRIESAIMKRLDTAE